MTDQQSVVPGRVQPSDTMATIEALRGRGIVTAAGIARALNEAGITTPQGGRWYAILVQRLIANGVP